MALPQQFSNTGATPGMIKIPNYAPPNLNSGLKIQSSSNVPSVSTPEMFPGVTRALGNAGNWIAKNTVNQGGLITAPIASAVKSVGTTIGGMFGSGQQNKNPLIQTADAATIPSNQNNPPTPSTPGNLQQQQQMNHDAAIKAVQDKIKFTQGLLKDAQDKEASNIASYPSGVTPQKDAEGNTIAYTPPQGAAPDTNNQNNNPSASNNPAYATPTSDTTTPASQQMANIANLTNIGTGQENPQLTEARATLKAAQDKYGADLVNNASHAQTAGNLMGSEGVINQFDLRAIQNAQNILDSALTEQGQQISAAGTAGQLSTPQNTQYSISPGEQKYGMTGGLIGTGPVQLSPANTLVNPTTGQELGGGGVAGSLNSNAQTAVNNLVDAVGGENPSISYQDAASQLSGYGPKAVNALLPMIKAKYPNFNVNQANARSSAQASNTQQAGQISALVDKSNAILDTLPAKFDKLTLFQKTGSDMATTIANNLSNTTGYGVNETQDYVRTLNESKATIQSILSSAVNLGVNTGGATADSLLPINMTKEGLTQAISTIKDIQEKTKEAFAKLSNASGGSTNNSNSYSGDPFSPDNPLWQK